MVTTTSVSVVYGVLKYNLNNAEISMIGDIAGIIQKEYSYKTIRNVVELFINNKYINTFIEHDLIEKLDCFNNNIFNMILHKYTNLTNKAKCVILRYIKYNKLSDAFNTAFIDLIDTEVIQLFMEEYEEDIMFILKTRSINDFIRDCNKHFIKILIKYNTNLASYICNNKNDNSNENNNNTVYKKYAVKHAVKRLLINKGYYDIQRIILDCYETLLLHYNISELTNIFYELTMLIVRKKFDEYNKPNLILLFNELLKHKQFRSKLYNIQCLDQLYINGPPGYALGVIYGIIYNNTYTIISAINNIKHACENNILPIDDDLHVLIPMELRNRCSIETIAFALHCITTTIPTNFMDKVIITDYIDMVYCELKQSLTYHTKFTTTNKIRIYRTNYGEDIIKTVVKMLMTESNIVLNKVIEHKVLSILKYYDNAIFNVIISKYILLSSKSKLIILKYIGKGYVNNDVSIKYIHQLDTTDINTYLIKYKSKIQPIIDLVGMPYILGKLNTPDDIKTLITRSEFVMMYLYRNKLYMEYLLPYSVEQLLKYNKSNVIQHIVLYNYERLMSEYTISNLIMIVKAFIYFITLNKFDYYNHCLLVSLFYSLLEYKEFRDEIYCIDCLDQLFIHQQPLYALGVVYGIKCRDYDLIAKSIDNIKNAIENNIIPINDDLIILQNNLLDTFLRHHGYDITKFVYDYITDINNVPVNILDKLIDPKTKYNMSYLATNRECNVCFNETTDLCIPTLSEDTNYHNCTFVICWPCHKQVNNTCPACCRKYCWAE